MEFYAEFGNLSEKSLVAHNRYDLAGAIAQRYKGSIQKLRKDLALENKQKPKGYWTPELIEEEARKFYAEVGHISGVNLPQHKRSDLWGAIQTRYPGKMTALKEKLGIVEKPISPEEANEELMRFLEVRDE